MNFQDVLCAASLFFARFVLDAAFFWEARYLYLKWVKKEQKRVFAEMESEVPFGPEETVGTHAERKILLGQVRTAILVQQKAHGTGLECKQ
jgi:hypothetical protein